MKNARKKIEQKKTVYPQAKHAVAIHDHPTPNPLRVAELFAGVGGFRIGLENANKQLKREAFKVVWGNQYEPSTKIQHAYRVYESKFKEGKHSNQDISKVPQHEIPEIEVLVGGFPCQDYSVARTLNQATGLAGKKGVLWWEIHRLLRDIQPSYGIFENVDRLLASPSGQRGRDFAVMLASLADIRYVAEWRVINAADFGMPQRRKRTFLVVARHDTALAANAEIAGRQWLTEGGILATAFPCTTEDDDLALPSFELEGDLADISETFNVAGGSKTPFLNAGLMFNRQVYTQKVTPDYHGKKKTLGDILLPIELIPESYFIPPPELADWRFLKGAKSLERRKANGIVYSYDEGPIAFPDPLDKASRTIITGEGGSTPSRFKHVVQMPDGRFRRLVPIELERLNEFPDNHTLIDGVSDVKRAFFMGNALVTGVVKKIGITLAEAVAGNH